MILLKFIFEHLRGKFEGLDLRQWLFNGNYPKTQESNSFPVLVRSYY